MSDQIPQIRQAETSEQDTQAFAFLFEQATDGVFHELLGPTSPDFLASVYLEPDHDLSYEHVMFAEINGDVAGMISAFTTADHAKNVGHSRSIVARASGIRIARMAAVAPEFVTSTSSARRCDPTAYSGFTIRCTLALPNHLFVGCDVAIHNRSRQLREDEGNVLTTTS